MLHQPASTFEPLQPAPSTAQPFDAKRYLRRAKQLGIMLFPSISPSGRHLYGLCAYPGHSFGDGNRRLAEEFNCELEASSDGTATVFEALCEDFGLDPADERFNEKANATCRARSHASADGDKRLIHLCKRAKNALEKDLAATDLLCELTEAFEKTRPAQPTYELASGTYRESLSAAEMKAKLGEIRAVNSNSAVKDYCARIAKVVAYEKECGRISREIGLTKAKSVADNAAARSIAAVTDVAELPATTMAGHAHKAAVFFSWDRAGYGLSDSTGELLAHSIADDARMLGTGGQMRPKRKRTDVKPHPLAQVH